MLKKRSDWVGSVLRISLRVPSLSARRVPLPRGIPWVARVAKTRGKKGAKADNQRPQGTIANPAVDGTRAAIETRTDAGVGAPHHEK